MSLERIDISKIGKNRFKKGFENIATATTTLKNLRFRLAVDASSCENLSEHPPNYLIIPGVPDEDHCRCQSRA